MEYHYQHGPHDKPVKLNLGEFDMVMESNGTIKRLSYASITEVRLVRTKDTYAIHIFALDHGVIRLSNKSCNGGVWVDQSRGYHTFVRVLHLHLSNKSKAIFYSGSNLGEYARKGLVLLLITAVLFLGEEYFDFLPMRAALLAISFFAVGALIVLIPVISRWPKSYSPAEIPLDLLPPA